ncbi:hypothetical protein HDU80_001180 [Chytriomyces hyalinus]|nr:hypothetical protein HDU80_001180 [Chytriomyces hyalinus]
MPLDTKLDAAVSDSLEPISLHTDTITPSHSKNENEDVELEADNLSNFENAELSEPIVPYNIGETDFLPEAANAFCVEPVAVSLDSNTAISPNADTTTASSVFADGKESTMPPAKHEPDFQAESMCASEVVNFVGNEMNPEAAVESMAINRMKSLQEELAPFTEELDTENQQDLDTIETSSISQPAFPDLIALSAKPLQTLENPFDFDDDGFDDVNLENSLGDTVKTSEYLATRIFPVAPLENPFGEEDDELDEVDISAAAMLKNNESLESLQRAKTENESAKRSTWVSVPIVPLPESQKLDDEFDQVDISTAALKSNLQATESVQSSTIENESVKRSPCITVPIKPLPESNELEVDDEVDISIPLSATAVAAERDVLVRDDLITPSAETLEPVSSGNEQRATVGESNLNPGLKSNTVEFDNERMILMSNAMDFIDSLKLLIVKNETARRDCAKLSDQNKVLEEYITGMMEKGIGAAVARK